MIKRSNFVLLVTTLIIMPFFTSTYTVLASTNLEYSSATSEFVQINPNLSLIIDTETFDTYNIVTVTDSDGNISISDSRYNYVLENGEKITATLTEEFTTYPNNNLLNQRKAVPAWQKIRSNKVTASFDRVIKDVLIGTLLAKVNKILGHAYTVVSVVKTAYDKPDLKSSKVFYLNTNIYGKTNQLNYEGRHTYSLDAKNRVISKTDHFSDSNLKKFLGY